MSNLPLTTGEVAQFCGVEIWRVRRAVDSLPGPVHRVGRNRVIPRSQLPEVTAELARRGWLPREEAGNAS